MTHAAPLNLHQEVVLPAWIDYNGHMNLAFYVLAFDHATDELIDYMGMDAAYRQQTQSSVFTLEIHVNYMRELVLGDPLRCTTQLLDFDQKRVHYFHHMYHAEQDYLAATNEVIMINMDMETRRTAAMAQPILDRLKELQQAHQHLPRPVQVGNIIGIRRNG